MKHSSTSLRRSAATGVLFGLLFGLLLFLLLVLIVPRAHAAQAIKDLTVSGNTTLSGNVTSNATITGGTLANATLSGGTLANATISGNTSLSGNVTSNATVTGGTLANLTLTGTSTLNGTTTLSGNVTSNGTATFSGTLAGTPTGGTLNLANLTLTLPASVSGGTSSFAPITSGSQLLYGNGGGGFTNATRTLLILGDSLSAANAQPGATGNWPYYLNQLPDFRAWTIVNNAVSGQSAETIAANLSTQALPYLPVGAPFSQTIVSVWAGINDINGAGPSGAYNSLKTIWAYCRSRGAKVLASTQTYAAGAANSLVDELNRLILSDATLYDSISRPDLDFPSYSTTIPSASALAVTGAASTNLLTSVAHGYSNGDVLYLVVSSGLAGLSNGVKYFVVSASTDAFSLSTTAGGSAVDITTDGSGTVTLAAYYPDNTHLTPPANAILAANKQRELAVYGYETISARKGGTVAAQSVAAFNVFSAAPSTTLTQFGGRDYRTLWINGQAGLFVESFSGYEAGVMIYNMRLDSSASAWRLIDATKHGWRLSLTGGTTDNGFSLSTIPAGSTTETRRFNVDGSGNITNVAAITASGTIAAGGNVTAGGTLGFSSHTFLTGTGTWDPGSLADGAAESFDVTVTGAEVGDIVMGVALSSLTGNRFVISGYITSANTVRCVIFNKSAGNVDLGSGTVRVVVLHW